MAQKVGLEIKIATILGRKISLVREQIFPLMVVLARFHVKNYVKKNEQYSHRWFEYCSQTV